MSASAATTPDYHSGKRRRALPAWIFPGAYFYSRIVGIVVSAARLAKRGRYDNDAWVASSLNVVDALERAGCEVHIENLSVLDRIDGPCVFVGNHMSTLETFVLPMVIQPHRPVTFVVKQSLVEYPIFKHVMRSRNPIVVGRTNPREDLKAVLEGGKDRIEQGTSIIVFPQTTRTAMIDPETFNSIGVKLAKRSGVRVVPVAIQSRAWGTGKLIKDFGPFDPSIPVRFAFGEPLEVSGTGRETHEAVISFITAKLRQWQDELAPAPANI